MLLCHRMKPTVVYGTNHGVQNFLTFTNIEKKKQQTTQKKRQQMLTKFLTLILFNGFSRSEFVSESKNDAILILISGKIEYEYYVYNISNTKIWCHLFAPALSSTFLLLLLCFHSKVFFTENGPVEKTLNLQFDSKVSVKIHTLLNHVYGSVQKLVLFARSIWYIYIFFVVIYFAYWEFIS